MIQKRKSLSKINTGKGILQETNLYRTFTMSSPVDQKPPVYRVEDSPSTPFTTSTSLAGTVAPTTESQRQAQAQQAFAQQASSKVGFNIIAIEDEKEFHRAIMETKNFGKE